jgi:predicted Zn-dependent peptidase
LSHGFIVIPEPVRNRFNNRTMKQWSNYVFILMIYKKIIFFIFAIIFWNNNLYAADARNIKLPNGFEVILIENHQNPVISCVVTVKTGSAHEDYGNSGVSHMLEHLLFNGTGKRTQEALYKETDFYGIYNNAHTDADYTNYIVLAEKTHADKALDIQSDMLFNSIFPEDKFEKEKGIILNEIARDMSEPSFFENQIFNLRFFGGTAYNLPVIGTPETIKNMTRGQVIEYYKRYYIPNNMTALVMGDFKSNEMLKLMEKYFGKYPHRKLPKEKDYNHQPSSIVHRLSSVVSSSMIMGMPVNKEDFYAVSVIADLLDSDLKDGVNRNLKENNRAEVSDISVSADFNRRFSFLEISVSFPHHLESVDVKNAVIEELNKFCSEPIDEDRVKGIIVSTRVQEVFLSEKPHYYGMTKGKLIAAGGWDFAKNYIQNLEGLSKDKLEDIAKKYLSAPAFMTSLITYGEDTVDSVRERIKDDYYRTGEKHEMVESQEAIVESRESRVESRELKSPLTPLYKRGAGGVKKGVIKKVNFKNGLILIVNSNSDSEVFAAHVLSKNRSLIEPEGKTGIVDFIHRIMERGTRDKDYRTFQKEASAIGAALKTRDSEFIPYDDYYTTHDYSYIRLETIDEYYDKGIEMLADIILNPRFEHDDIEFVRSDMLDIIKREDSKPDILSKKLFFAEIFKGSPYSKSITGTDETINSITKDDLENFHRLYFSPNNLIITVATSIEADNVIERFRKLLGRAAKQRIKAPVIDFTGLTSNSARSVNISLNKSQSYIRTGKFIKIAPSDKSPLRLLGYILSERISFELREKQGLAYSLGAGFSFYDNYAIFGASMGTMKETIGRAREGILGEIERLKEADIKKEDLERAVNRYISSELMRGLSRINQCYSMGVAEFYKRDIDYRKSQFAGLKKARLEDINRVKKKYLSIDNLIEVVVE